MTFEKIQEKIKSLTERIHVLEAERTNEKYILPLYAERSTLLDKIQKAQRLP